MLSMTMLCAGPESEQTGGQTLSKN